MALRSQTRVLSETLTAGHQFDVPPVEDPLLVAALAADCDVLRFVEGHLAAHTARHLCLADVVLDAQHIWLRHQWLPQRRVVVAPAGIKPGRGQKADERIGSKDAFCA